MTTPDAIAGSQIDDKARIAELEDILRDIAMGAQMTLPLASGAYASYVREVERVATAGLPARTQAALARMKGVEDKARTEMHQLTSLVMPLILGTPETSH